MDLDEWKRPAGGRGDPQEVDAITDRAAANEQVLVAANAAVAHGDYPGFLEYCTDDTEWVFVGDRTLRGKASVLEWMTATYVEPPRNHVTQLISAGDMVVATGEIVTVEGGRDVRRSYCDLWRVRDGKLHTLRAFVV